MRGTKENRLRPLTFIIHFAFLLCGIVTVLIGQILPVLSRRLDLDDAEAGGLFIAQFSGSLCGTLLFGYAAKRFGFVKTSLFGFVLIAAGCLLLNSHLWHFCVLGLFLNGVGIGCSLGSINMLVVVLNPLRQASALSILNFFWGVGAILSQPFVAFFGTADSILVPTAVLSALFAGAALAFYFIRAETGAGERTSERTGAADNPVWTHPVAWLIAAFNFVHVGFESGAGGWLTTYSARFPDGAGSLLSATPAYFLFFVIGRAVAPLWLRFLDENRFLFLSLLVLTAGNAVIFAAPSFEILLAGACIAGFGTSAIFPANTARFTKIFGEGAARRAMPLFLSGSLGGAFTTWLIGFVSEKWENLQSGIFILLAGGLVLIVLQILIASNSYVRQTDVK
jgi:FHS family glucose/mannose:H+ symporter-like MFS transporter